MWSKIEAGRNNASAWLTVNYSTISTDISSLKAKFLNTFTNIYVGGVGDWDTLSSSAVSGVPAAFHGCMRQLSVNGDDYQLNERVAVEGLNVGDCDGGMCGYKVCNGGNCTALPATRNTVPGIICSCESVRKY